MHGRHDTGVLPPPPTGDWIVTEPQRDRDERDQDVTIYSKWFGAQADDPRRCVPASTPFVLRCQAPTGSTCLDTPRAPTAAECGHAVHLLLIELLSATVQEQGL